MIPALDAPAAEAAAAEAIAAQHLLPEAALTVEKESNLRAAMLLLRAQSVQILAAAVAAADIMLMDITAALAAYISASIFKGV